MFYYSKYGRGSEGVWETMKFRVEGVGDEGKQKEMNATDVEKTTYRYEHAQMCRTYMDGLDDHNDHNSLKVALVEHVWNQDGEQGQFGF